MVTASDIARTDFIIADINDTVSSLIGQMERHKECYAVVFEDSNYKGIVAKKWLLSSRIDPAEMKLKNIFKHRSKSKTPFFVPTLSPNTELREIARLMATADVHALPIIITEQKKEHVIGMAHSLDVIANLRTFYSRVRADELASMKLVTINQNEKVSKAMNLMSKQGISKIVVVDSQNKLIGILGLTDILIDVHAFPRTRMRIPHAASHQMGKHTGFGVGEKTNLLELPVHNVITHVPNCITAAPEESMASIIDLMVNNDVSSVVLVKKEIPVGIITIKDILEDFSKE
ncbi:MAG: CBS domain-containing protein [Candidatus Woesearchaeota archaeon]